MADIAGSPTWQKALHYVERAKNLSAKAREKAQETTKEVVETAVTAGVCFGASFANERYGAIKSSEGAVMQLGGDDKTRKSGVPLDGAVGLLGKGATIFGVFGKPSSTGGLSTNSVASAASTGLLCAFAARKGMLMGHTARQKAGEKKAAGAMGPGSYSRANAAEYANQGVG
jgi:hypothetical protein